MVLLYMEISTMFQKKRGVVSSNVLPDNFKILLFDRMLIKLSKDQLVTQTINEAHI